MRMTPTPDPFWDAAQSPLGSTVVGGLILAALLALIALLWRKKIWQGLGGLVGRIRAIGISVNTAKQRKVATDAAISAALDKFKVNIGPEVAGMAVKASQAAEAAKRRAEAEYRRGFDAGLAEARKEYEDAFRFEPKTRWSVTRGPLGKFFLKNAGKGSVAKAVRLEAPNIREFSITSHAQWEDFSGERVATFEGRATSNGAHHGVTFRVDFTDGQGTTTWEEVFLDGWDPGVY